MNRIPYSFPHSAYSTCRLNTLPEPLKPFADKISNLFGWLVPPCTRFVVKECKSMLSVGIPMTDEITRVRALMTQMEALLYPVLSDEEKTAEVRKTRCIYICIYIYIYMCVCVYICVYIYIYIYTYVYIHVCDIFVFTYIYTYSAIDVLDSNNAATLAFAL